MRLVLTAAFFLVPLAAQTGADAGNASLDSDADFQAYTRAHVPPDAGSPGVVPSGRPSDEVASVIQLNLFQVRSCYREMLAIHPQLSGSVDARFVIDANGKVSQASVIRSTVRLPELERCLLDRIKTWVFPESGQPDVVVTYPFLFIQTHSRESGTPSADVAAGDKELVRVTIRGHVEEVLHCYERELPNHPRLGGMVAIKFLVASDGTVPLSKVARSTVNNPELEHCVAALAKTWMFPRPPWGGTMVITYPFTFKQSAAPNAGVNARSLPAASRAVADGGAMTP